MAKKPFLTKEEFTADLKTVLYVVIQEFNRIYGSLALVDIKTSEIREAFNSSPDEMAEALNITNMPVGFYMNALYDYAIEGRLDQRLEDDWEIVDEDIVGFFRGLEDFPLIWDNAENFPLDSCLKIIDMSHARRLLDNSGYVVGDAGDVELGHMQLKEVALLAGIDEKTARNLALPNAKNRLETENWQGRTIVKVAFAKEWLKKRGLKETIVFDSALERDFTRQGFSSLRDLGNFVSLHRSKLGLSVGELLERANLGADSQGWYENLEAGVPTFNTSGLVKLAKAFGIKAKPFVMAAGKVIQAAWLARLEEELDQNA